ncbi:unnamed protein product [Camellia sinensis]
MLQRTKRFQLVCYASKPQTSLWFIKTETTRPTRALSITCIAACQAPLLMARRFLSGTSFDEVGAPFDGTPFNGLGTPFDGTPFERLGTPFEGATF